MGTVIWQSGAAAGIDRSSLVYSFISGEEVIEGPLDPSAYAQTEGPGIGGSRLAALDASDTDLITFDDPEVQFAETLGGNAVLAPLQPLVPEPGTPESGETKIKRPTIYTVQEGDTIADIAAKFDISENTVLWANRLSSRTTIKVGDHLTILPTTGVLHTVQEGDTVSGIARKYDTKGSEIIAYNGLNEDAKLSIGQKVIVPDGYIAPQQAPQILPSSTRIADRDPDSGPTPEPALGVGSGFVWPTVTKHISQYFKWGHTGVDIDNRSRPAIYAADGGTVEFNGWLGGYGNLIIINHGGGVTTYYAHLDKFYVSKGQTVKKGAAIAQMGSTGRSTGPHLHFEVRKNGKPINPLGFF
jgi:LysM repeat protein